MYAELHGGDYARLRRALVRRASKGSSTQREFLEAVRENEKFLKYIRDAVGVQEGVELDPLADRMSEAEFANPPSDTERRLFEAWSGLTPRIACRTTFWGRVTYRHIEEGRIESVFLAANGGGNVSGAQRIDAALSAAEDESTSLMDKCVRTALRRFGGLPEARGNRSVYVNCPLARAWWRERLVEEVATNGGQELQREIRAVVHPESQQYWEELVTFIVSRNSVFGNLSVRNALIQTLAKVLDENPRSPLRTADELRRVCRSVSSIQASFELSVLPSEDLAAMMGEVVKTAT